jgi:hypothetical protein
MLQDADRDCRLDGKLSRLIVSPMLLKQARTREYGTFTTYMT